MSCRVFRSRIVAFADGELPPDEAEPMARHVRDCAECAAELAAVEREAALYAAALRPHAAPADLAGGVMGALEGVDILPAPAPVRHAGIPLRWVAGTAAAAAGLLFMMLGGMGAALHSRSAAEAPSSAWAVIPANQPISADDYRGSHASRAVQVSGFRRAPSGGPVYWNAPPEAKEPSPPRPAGAFRFTSFDGQPLHHAAPDFQVQEYRQSGDAKDMNMRLGHPQAVTEAEQRGLNGGSQPGAPAATGPRGAPGGMSPGIHSEWAATPQTSPAPGYLSSMAPQRALSAVVVDSTDARVVLTVGYEEEDDRYITVYDADFQADYVVRAPDSQAKAVRIAVTFPFPNDCSTVSGSRLLVDQKADDEQEVGEQAADPAERVQGGKKNGDRDRREIDQRRPWQPACLRLRFVHGISPPVAASSVLCVHWPASSATCASRSAPCPPP